MQASNDSTFPPQPLAPHLAPNADTHAGHAAPWWYRARIVITVTLAAIAFTAPWEYSAAIAAALNDARTHVWEVLASPLGGTSTAFNALLVVAVLLGALGAALRVWGAAYLGMDVVKSGALHGEGVVADGPYRHLRNPLYLGLMLHTLAISLIMQPSGAVFGIVTIFAFMFCLIAAEEKFLAARLGEPYAKYRSRMPSLLYSVLPRVIGSGTTAPRPRWVQAMLGEIYMIAVPVGFAIFGWRYDNQLLLKVIIISLGVSIVVRALLPRRSA